MNDGVSVDTGVDIPEIVQKQSESELQAEKEIRIAGKLPVETLCKTKHWKDSHLKWATRIAYAASAGFTALMSVPLAQQFIGTSETAPGLPDNSPVPFVQQADKTTTDRMLQTARAEPAEPYRNPDIRALEGPQFPVDSEKDPAVKKVYAEIMRAMKEDAGKNPYFVNIGPEGYDAYLLNRELPENFGLNDFAAFTVMTLNGPQQFLVPGQKAVDLSRSIQGDINNCVLEKKGVMPQSTGVYLNRITYGTKTKEQIVHGNDILSGWLGGVEPGSMPSSVPSVDTFVNAVRSAKESSVSSIEPARVQTSPSELDNALSLREGVMSVLRPSQPTQ